jgi:hypothetical protein
MIANKDIVPMFSVIVMFLGQFVASAERGLVTKLKRCGVLRIGKLIAIGASYLANFLGLYKTQVRMLLTTLPWSRLAYNSPEYVEQVKTLNANPWNVPACVSKNLIFLVADETMTVDNSGKLPSDSTNSGEIIHCKNRTISSLKMKIARSRLAASDRRTAGTQTIQEAWEPSLVPPYLSSTHDFAWLHDELRSLANVAKNLRRYSDRLGRICTALHDICPKVYRVLRQLFPLPSVTTITANWGSQRKELIAALAPEAVRDRVQLLWDYRRHSNIPDDQRVLCTLAFDATSVSQTGISPEKVSENCFSFVMLPLDSQFEDLLLESFPHETGRMDKIVLGRRDQLCQILRENQFVVTFVATDGDTGVNPLHRSAFNRYATFDVNARLGDIVASLTEDGLLICWPTPDLLHLMKNARGRIASGVLAFNSSSAPISGDFMNEKLGLARLWTAHAPLDLLKDELALRAFSLDHLVALLGNDGNLGAAYFLLPFVCLNLAVRNPELCKMTRLDLIETAFSVFFRMIKNYPETANGNGFYIEHGRQNGKKTYWTRMMCIRGCNLCVALYWALSNFDAGLSLGRIGTHPVECLFGTTRSLLRGDTRWERFLWAEADAMLVRGIMREESLTSHIRRFRCASGHILCADTDNMIHADFGDMADELTAAAWLLAQTGTSNGNPLAEITILGVFAYIQQELQNRGYKDGIAQSSPTAGNAIMSRYFAARKPGVSPDGNDDATVVDDEDGDDEDGDDEDRDDQGGDDDDGDYE